MINPPPESRSPLPAQPGWLTTPPSPGASKVSTARVRVRRIPYGSLAKFGLVLGVLGMTVPGLLLGLGGWFVAHALRGWLEGWQAVNISLLGQNITTLNLLNALHLTDFAARLRVLDAAGPLAVFAVTVAVALIGGLLVAAVTVMLGLAYNLLAWFTGGLVLEIEQSGSGQ